MTRVEDGAGDREKATVEDGAGDREKATVEDGTGDREKATVEDGAGDREKATVEDGAGDREKATVEDGTGDGDRAGDGDGADGGSPPDGDGRARPSRPAPGRRPFDDALVGAVAADAGIEPGRLRALLAAHQSTVGAYASVAGWLYELRRASPRDPLVAREGRTHYLAVEATVWAEFAPALGVEPDGPALAAVRAVHDRALRAAVPHPGDGREAMVVVA